MKEIEKIKMIRKQFQMDGITVPVCLMYMLYIVILM